MLNESHKLYSACLNHVIKCKFCASRFKVWNLSLTVERSEGSRDTRAKESYGPFTD